ncbi:hypothetical protein RIR_jg12449.t1 [Rhizophagus irregularis DAOM 181602=DAOM 197198]|nr:hypothetical protein RIR_jg12449.t1 [Rhizophagus irregularis DAOM 181602=DAOM 197198]
MVQSFCSINMTDTPIGINYSNTYRKQFPFEIPDDDLTFDNQMIDIDGFVLNCLHRSLIPLDCDIDFWSEQVGARHCRIYLPIGNIY